MNRQYTSIADRAEAFSGFYSTVVDPMPKADKTHEEIMGWKPSVSRTM